MKRLLNIQRPPRRHWVGDGFPVRSLFSYQTHGKALSPFLLLDFAGPAEFAPADRPRGVGEHPHRGFETVTIVYEGEVAHRDSTGKSGVIGPGDVQWMTAASGILHEEFHSEGFTRSGGTFLVAQLWVNLPARHKLDPPGYQPILARDIPEIALPDGAGRIRVIAGAGACEGKAGPARTFSPMNVWDLHLSGGHTADLTLPDGWNTAVVVMRGSVRVNGSEPLGEAQMAVLSPSGEQVVISVESDSIVLLLSGEPIVEPIVGDGPFVMNSEAEIHQAMADFNSGQFGEMPA